MSSLLPGGCVSPAVWQPTSRIRLGKGCVQFGDWAGACRQGVAPAGCVSGPPVLSLGVGVLDPAQAPLATLQVTQRGHPTWCVCDSIDVRRYHPAVGHPAVGPQQGGAPLVCCVALKALQVGSRIFKPGHKGHTSPDVMLSGWFFLFVYNSLPLCQRIRAGRCAVRWSPAVMCRGCWWG